MKDGVMLTHKWQVTQCPSLKCMTVRPSDTHPDRASPISLLMVLLNMLDTSNIHKTEVTCKELLYNEYLFSLTNSNK